MTEQIRRRQRRGRGQLVPMTFRMTPELHATVLAAAKAHGVTKAAWIVSVVARELELPGYELPSSKNEKNSR